LSRLGTDSKAVFLGDVLESLRQRGRTQVMVFTQYTDTMDFLRDLLRDRYRLMCFSGRGGAVPMSGGQWRVISRDEARNRVRGGAGLAWGRGAGAGGGGERGGRGRGRRGGGRAG